MAISNRVKPSFVITTDEGLLKSSPYQMVISGQQCIPELELQKSIPELSMSNKLERIKRYIVDEAVEISGVIKKKITIIPANYTFNIDSLDKTIIRNVLYYSLDYPNVWFNVQKENAITMRQAINIYINSNVYKTIYGCNLAGLKDKIFLKSYDEYLEEEEEKNKAVILELINANNKKLENRIANAYSQIKSNEDSTLVHFKNIYDWKKLIETKRETLDLPKGVRIQSENLVMNTNDIIVSFASKRIYFGKFEVTYKVSERQIFIRNTEFKTHNVCHPHISSYICWGGFKEKITTAIEDNDFNKMFAIVMVFLSEHSDISTFVKALLFPHIDENGKLTNLANTKFHDGKRAEDYDFNR